MLFDITMIIYFKVGSCENILEAEDLVQISSRRVIWAPAWPVMELGRIYAVMYNAYSAVHYRTVQCSEVQ